jgi:hypothetical protein
MTRKLTVMKHVRAPPRRNIVPTESHSDGQCVGYFPTTLWTLLLALGYGKPPLFIGTPRLLHGNSYLWHVCVVIYERSTTDRIHYIYQIIKASALRWTFEGGMRDVVQESLAVLRHEVDDQMEHSQYHHFSSCAREGVEAVVMSVGDHDRIGCFTDQVKLTRALVQDLDNVIKEVKMLGEHGEEASQRITEHGEEAS